MKGYCGSGGIVPCVLDLALDRGEWSVSHPDHFNSGERSRCGRGSKNKKKILASARNLTPVVQPVA